MNIQSIKDTPPVALTAYNKVVIAAALLAAPLAAAGAPTAPLADSYGSIAKPTVSPWSVEVAGGYRFAARHMQSFIFAKDGRGARRSWITPKVDLVTTDITGVYRFNERHAATLRFGFGSGTDTIGLAVMEKPWQKNNDFQRKRVNVFSLMPGYRFTQPVYKEKLSVFGGVNVGITNESVKVLQYSVDPSHLKAFDRHGVHCSDYGLGYSAEVGLRYDFTEHIGAFVAYEFFGSTAQPIQPNFIKSTTFKEAQNHQLYHGIRAGVSYRF